MIPVCVFAMDHFEKAPVDPKLAGQFLKAWPIEKDIVFPGQI